MANRLSNVTRESAQRLGPVTAGLYGAILAGCATGGAGCGGTPFESRRAEVLTAPAEAVFTLENTVGDVRVVADPAATQVRMEVTRIGKGSTQQKAAEAVDELRFDLIDTPGNDGVVVKTIQPTHRWSSEKQYAAEWVITAPPGTRIVVTDDVGDVTVVGFQNGVRAQTDVGDLRIAGVSGPVTASSDVGDIHVNADGPAEVSSDVGDVRVEIFGSAAVPVKVVSNVGDVHVVLPPAWAGTVDGRTNVGGISGAAPGVARKGDRNGSGGSLVGAIGTGGASLTARADVGDLTVDVRQVARASE